MQKDETVFLSKVLAAAGYRAGGGKRDHYTIFGDLAREPKSGYCVITNYRLEPSRACDSVTVSGMLATIHSAGITAAIPPVGNTIIVDIKSLSDVSNACWLGQRQGWKLPNESKGAADAPNERLQEIGGKFEATGKAIENEPITKAPKKSPGMSL